MQWPHLVKYQTISVIGAGPLIRPNWNRDSHKIGHKSGQFNNFTAQAARKLTKLGRNSDRFYKFPTQKKLSQLFLYLRRKSGLNRDSFLKMSSKGPAMESKSKRTPSGLNLIAPGKWNQVSERGLAPWPWICWIWSNGPSSLLWWMHAVWHSVHYSLNHWRKPSRKKMKISSK